MIDTKEGRRKRRGGRGDEVTRGQWSGEELFEPRDSSQIQNSTRVLTDTRHWLWADSGWNPNELTPDVRRPQLLELLLRSRIPVLTE